MQLGGKAICVSQSPSDLLLRPETRAVKKLSQYEWERPLDCYRALRPNRATRREPSTDSSGLTSVRIADHPPGVVGASSLTANALAKCDRFRLARLFLSVKGHPSWQQAPSFSLCLIDKCCSISNNSPSARSREKLREVSRSSLTRKLECRARIVPRLPGFQSSSYLVLRSYRFFQIASGFENLLHCLRLLAPNALQALQ
jgi:hypothetical protein